MNDDMKMIASIILPVTLLITGCGGSDGGDDPETEGTTATGYFLDNAEGLNYRAGEISGITDSDGAFTYAVGEPIAFAIGDITLGTASAGDAIITPVDLVLDAEDETNTQVANIARLLQSLDDDGDYANGISINSAVRVTANRTMNISSMDRAEFGADDVQLFFSSLMERTTSGSEFLISESVARDNLRNSLIGILVGNYEGTFEGGDSGTFGFSIFGDGVIEGHAENLEGETLFLNGEVNSDRTGAIGDVESGASFDMVIAKDGTVSGTWENPFYGISGSFTGAKN